ncbi:MAG TPA: anti-sigma factor [Burkholderiales bacterium]|nr:anti-sigma factor [Burkholderiales bacterium]
MTREEAAGLLHAYVDGELDAAKSVELEAHLAGNPAARAASERLREMSAAIRDRADYHAAPASLAARLRASVPTAPEEIPRRAGWGAWLRPAALIAAIALVTWVVAVVVMRPGEDERIAQEVLASHVRETLGNRLYDVASSDQHTVKPWLSARLAFSPPVADFSAHGFELQGGRLDYVGGQSVAVLVYRRRQHVIDVFVWPAPAQKAGQALTRNGFNIESFAHGGMGYWLVSDLNRNELGDFARLLAAAP